MSMRANPMGLVAICLKGTRARDAVTVGYLGHGQLECERRSDLLYQDTMLATAHLSPGSFLCHSATG